VSCEANEADVVIFRNNLKLYIMPDFSFSRGFLFITDRHGKPQHPTFVIPETELVSRSEFRNNTSIWMTRLGEELWIPTHMLYKLAKQINERFPENGINWCGTFIAVEKHRVHCKNLKNVLKKKSRGSCNFKFRHIDVISCKILAQRLDKADIRSVEQRVLECILRNKLN
jgi:hypothetical protein